MADVNKSMRVNVDTAGGVASLRALTGAFNGVLGVIGLAVAALGLLTVAAFKAGKQFIEFERSVIKINTLLPKTDRAAADVKGRLLELSKALPNQEIDDLADSVYTLTSLLQDEAKAFELAEVAGNAAIGTNTTAAITTDALTKAMKAFNMTTDEGKTFMDDYVAAVNAGVITGEKLGQNFGTAGMAMGKMNGTAVETLALFSQLAPALSEEEIAVGLENVQARILTNKKAFDDAGVSTESWSQMLKDIEEKDVALPDIFGSNKRSLKFMEALMLQTNEYRGLIDEINTSTGDLEEATSAYYDTTAGVFDTAGKTIEVFSIQAGEKFADIGAAFLSAMADAGAEDVFDMMIDVLEDVLPLLIPIATVLGGVILNVIKDWVENWKTLTSYGTIILDFLTKIGEDLGFIRGDVDDATQGFITIGDLLSFILNKLHPVKLAVDALAKSFIFILSVVEKLSKVIEILRLAFEKFLIQQIKSATWFGRTLNTVIEITKWMKKLGKAVEDYLIDAIVKANQLFDRFLINFSRFFGVQIGGIDQTRLDQMTPGGKQVISGEGLGQFPDDTEDIDDTTDSVDKLTEAVYDGVTAWDAMRMAYEETAESLDEVGPTQRELLSAGRQGATAKPDTDKGAIKRVSNIFAAGILDAIKTGEWGRAMGDMFTNILSSAFSKGISKGIGALLGMIPGIGGFLSALFAKGGYLHDNKVHYAADGLFLANRTGANVLRHRPGGVPVVAAEAGVDEVNAFAPLNDTGFRLMMDEVMPLFPQFSEQMRGLGTMASQSFVYGARAQEAILGSMTPTFLVDVNPLLGSTVDVAISEAAQRGSRIKSSRTTN